MMLCVSDLKKPPYRVFDEDYPFDFRYIGEYNNNPAQSHESPRLRVPPGDCDLFMPGEWIFDETTFASYFKRSTYPGCFPPPDFVFYVDGRGIEAHRVMLSARSPYFKHKFETDWKDIRCFTFSKDELSYNALEDLIYFFYTDWVDTALEDLEDLATISQRFRCESFSRIINKLVLSTDFSPYTHITLTGSLLPEEDRLRAALYRVLQLSLANSMNVTSENVHDLADICVKVDEMIFRCHQVVLAARSEYFKKRIRQMHDSQQKDDFHLDTLPCLEEHDLSPAVFQKMLEYMYTGGLTDIDPKQAEELFDASSRYLLSSLHGVLAKILLPHVEMASSPAEICDWLLFAEVYKVVNIKFYCMVRIARDFQTFANTREFRAILLTFRNTAPSPFGPAGGGIDRFYFLDDLRETWLRVERAKLDKNNENAEALSFDMHLQELMRIAEQEQN